MRYSLAASLKSMSDSKRSDVGKRSNPRPFKKGKGAIGGYDVVEYLIPKHDDHKGM
jgi:hypothetical protein